MNAESVYGFGFALVMVFVSIALRRGLKKQNVRAYIDRELRIIESFMIVKASAIPMPKGGVPEYMRRGLIHHYKSMGYNLSFDDKRRQIRIFRRY